MENQKQESVLKRTLKKSVKKVLGRIYYHGRHPFGRPSGNRILIYHAVGSQLPDDTYGTSISLPEFRDHLSFLSDHFEVVSLSQAVLGSYRSDISVTLTFDDGYRDNLLAAEVCEKAGLPYTIYVIAEKIGDPLFLSAADLRDLHASGLCTLGSHGMTHRLLGNLPPEEARQEITESQARIRDLTGCTVRHLSYPHGSYHPRLFAFLQEAGYETAACSDVGLNTGSSPGRYQLRRTEVVASDNTMDLREKVLGYYDFLAIRNLSRRFSVSSDSR